MVFDVGFLRDCLEWKKENLDLGTTSDQACKLYDASLRQLVGWFDSKLYNGLEASLDEMIKADNEFILGHCLKLGIETTGSSNALCKPDYADQVNALVKLARSKPLSRLQTMHVNAIRNVVEGNLNKACDCWEAILIDHPTDMMALKFAHDAYFYQGLGNQMRDSIARVLPKWKASLPMYSYLYGMNSFGFAQSNFFKESEAYARKGLELNPNDAWATHALAHVTEYKNNYNYGIEFLRETEKDWSVCNYIAPHTYWHLALYHLERDEKDISLKLYDDVLGKSPACILNMVDSASMLFRLKLDGVNKDDLRERWAALKEIYKAKLDEHGFVFNDAHFFMTLSETGEEEEKKIFFKSLDTYINQEMFVLGSIDQSNNMEVEEPAEDKENINKAGNKRRPSRKLNEEKDVSRTLNEKYASAIFNAILSYDQSDYEKVVELLNPIRYDLAKMGGSNAQRDLYHQLLCQSALRSSRPDHKNLGLALLNERLSIKPNSCLTDRIIRRFAANHTD